MLIIVFHRELRSCGYIKSKSQGRKFNRVVIMFDRIWRKQRNRSRYIYINALALGRIHECVYVFVCIREGERMRKTENERAREKEKELIASVNHPLTRKGGSLVAATGTTLYSVLLQSKVTPCNCCCLIANSKSPRYRTRSAASNCPLQIYLPAF